MITPKDIEAFNNSELDDLFNRKLTENGDITHISSGNSLFDLFFQTAYFEKHLGKARIGKSCIEKLLSMFIRDPRHGLGRRDLGRELMRQADVKACDAVKAGRFDDLWETKDGNSFVKGWVDYLLESVKKGNNLAKKWMPHYVGKSKDGKVAKSTLEASKLRNILGINKQQYNKLVKTDTVESKLSQHRNDSIEFDKLPSLALLKYWARFAGTSKKHPKTDMAERFNAYLESVRKGEKKMNFSTATVYDIYHNADKIDCDLAFGQIKKVSGSWLPIVDTSSSMLDDDAYSKALSIGHYLAKCSTYAPNKVVTFSSYPQLIELGVTEPNIIYRSGMSRLPKDDGSAYCREVRSMHTGDCSNTDFGAVMKLIGQLRDDVPEYIIVLSDMEFDCGSNQENVQAMENWRQQGINTKLIWWNLNSRHLTSPQSVRSDSFGNLFLSGYNPTLLGLLDTSFSMSTFLAHVLNDYAEKINWNC